VVASVGVTRAVVECRGVVKRFGPRVAVDGLDLDVPAGLCFGLLGPNGAGKTTALRMIYGVAPATEGAIRVFGLDVATETRAVRARIGVTLQENALVEPLSPVENLRIFARYHLLARAEREARIAEVLDFLDLRAFADVPVAKLSGGFKRRLAIGLSLVSRPELLILDEPTTGLDPAVRIALWERVRELRDAGTSVLLTTHYMDEAERLCDRVAVLAAGRVVAEGEPARLIREALAVEALEVEVAPQAEALLLGGLDGVPRVRSGRQVALFVPDAAALLQALRGRGGEAARLRAVVRPANLEDLFLHLTGTRLESGEASAAPAAAGGRA